jgi:ubiquinone/menaquinone biosynthesis C-methylase UbiE
MSHPGAQELEHAGWVARAPRYRELFGTITWQAIEPVLAALGALDQVDFLDIASGTGELAGAAARRGARAHGIDYAATMVSTAQDRFAQVEFRVGDAEALPYATAAFGAAACLFGVPHFPDPQRALGEARRVLRAGGRFAMTSWHGPQDGGEFFALAEQVLAQCVIPDSAMAAPPSMFRLADADACRGCLAAAGFEDIEVRTMDLVWTCFSARAILELIEQSPVWAAQVLRTQPADVRERIARALDRAGEARRSGGKIAFHFPAVLATATAR